jgi:hypothetical protein
MSRTRRVATLAAMVVLIVLPAWVSTAQADPPGGAPVSVHVPWTGKVTATNADGHVLGHQPTLHRGDAVHFDITRLGPGEQVSVTVHSSNLSLGMVQAGDDGSAAYDLTVPADLATGAHTLTFAGVSSDATPTFAFKVASGGGAGGAGNNGNGSTGGNGPHSNGSGPLASTGVDAAALLIAAAALIIVGAGLTGAGRRRSGVST